MAWCFGTRPSVATALSTQPNISSHLMANLWLGVTHEQTNHDRINGPYHITLQI